MDPRSSARKSRDRELRDPHPADRARAKAVDCGPLIGWQFLSSEPVPIDEADPPPRKPPPQKCGGCPCRSRVASPVVVGDTTIRDLRARRNRVRVGRRGGQLTTRALGSSYRSACPLTCSRCPLPRTLEPKPDKCCLSLAAARLRYIAGTAWSAKCYMNMRPLYPRKSRKPESSPDQMCERICTYHTGELVPGCQNNGSTENSTLAPLR